MFVVTVSRRINDVGMLGCRRYTVLTAQTNIRLLISVVAPSLTPESYNL
jgi:hypothetical protein